MKNPIALSLCLCTAIITFAQAPNSNWEPDWDGDNNVGVSDLLGLLSVFGDNDVDDDGIWDSVDDCIGEYDECGFCNGPGIPNGYANCEDFYGPCNGIETVLFDGYEYSVIAIGNQCWFAENLRTTHYANGEEIVGDLTDFEWSTWTLGAQAIYGNNEESLDAYGRLYNWYALGNPGGICPVGWHRPSLAEWIELDNHTGGSGYAGLKLKSTNDDNPGWDGLNLFGFSAVPGGERTADGIFLDVDSIGEYWTASMNGSFVGRTKKMISNSDPNHQAQSSLQTGHSVRCIKD
jgi:uncharacterized protein (TIGR02145 family)